MSEYEKLKVESVACPECGGEAVNITFGKHIVTTCNDCDYIKRRGR